MARTDALPGGIRVLAGDTGGTTTRLGLFEVDQDRLHTVLLQEYANSHYAGLEALAIDFLESVDTDISAACFALAGPVVGPRVRLTNLPWVVDSGSLERATGLRRVGLINDLEATAWAVTRLQGDSIRTLNQGMSGAAGNGAVIAAGTGLGEAGLFWDGKAMRPFACEGGHAGFSPTDELCDGLLAFLRTKFGAVSWERVLSGPGLADLYRFLLEEAGRPEPDWFIAAQRSGDPVPAISAAGLDGRCEICRATLMIFARLYGEEAANLSLKLMATGGVWVAGGMAPKILPVLEDGHFMKGFLGSGRMRPLLESMPVRVVLDEHAALKGAAHRAASA